MRTWLTRGALPLLLLTTVAAGAGPASAATVCASTDGPTAQSSAVTLGVEDYLMGFKKKDNQDAVKKFLDLYYQPENITKWITAEGFLPVTKSGLTQMSANEKPACSALWARRTSSFGGNSSLDRE